jgi:cyclic beta-1,2-glucan synthetase
MITEPTPAGRKRLRLRTNPSWKSSDLQADLHGELFSLERLEEFARDLATEHKAITRRVPAKPLLANAEESGRILADVYSQLSGEANHDYVLMPGEEWLLDNYHVVRDTVAEVHVDLPRGYYLQLPRLAEGTWTGYPRVYAAVRELLLHTDGIVNVTNVEAFIRGYQAALPLNLGELWAVPVMLRLALVRNLAFMAQAMLDAHHQFAAANMWAERIMDLVQSKAASPGDTIAVPPELLHDTEQLTPTFVVRLLQNVRDNGPAVEPVLTWLERELRLAGSTPVVAVRTEFT